MFVWWFPAHPATASEFLADDLAPDGALPPTVTSSAGGQRKRASCKGKSIIGVSTCLPRAVLGPVYEECIVQLAR